MIHRLAMPVTLLRIPDSVTEEKVRTPSRQFAQINYSGAVTVVCKCGRRGQANVGLVGKGKGTRKISSCSECRP